MPREGQGVPLDPLMTILNEIKVPGAAVDSNGIQCNRDLKKCQGLMETGSLH